MGRRKKRKKKRGDTLVYISDSLRGRMFKRPFTRVIVETDNDRFLSIVSGLSKLRIPILSRARSVSSSFLSTVVNARGIGIASDIDGVRSISYDRTIGPLGRGWEYFRDTVFSGMQERVSDEYKSVPELMPMYGIDKDEKATGRNTRVAVIDSGIFRAHKSFRGRRVKSYGSYTKLYGSGDQNGHGTFCCASVSSNRYVNSFGKEVGGICESPIISIKSLVSPLAVGYDSTLIKAITMAVQHGAKIVSMSLGGPAIDPPEVSPLCKVVREYTEKGVIFVVAAGNDGEDNSVNDPGTEPVAVTVGSVATNGQIAPYSSRGSAVDCAGYGGDSSRGEMIYAATSPTGILDATDLLRNGWSALEGTSMSTPQVAGLVARWNDYAKEQYDGELMSDDVHAILNNIGHSRQSTDGHGVPQMDWIKGL